MYSIFATINIKPEDVEDFIAASLGDAQGSVRDEPGCFRFDISRDIEVPRRFYLYEVYRDEAAFQAHLKTPHFKAWHAVAEGMFDGGVEVVKMNTVFPSEHGWEQQKPDLLKW